ncbi:hypothetical protein AVEN_271731-1 [Araneus ventricosus]|uniref:Uncharacterized protein n=1 Tax=Araneus ventricosus TaxID=182803 RepID=A0A4Y2QM61_ARAVE|nr:hypothetical protein AVEN_271731-1 [Araneus ventricosus]
MRLSRLLRFPLERIFPFNTYVRRSHFSIYGPAVQMDIQILDYTVPILIGFSHVPPILVWSGQIYVEWRARECPALLYKLKKRTYQILIAHKLEAEDYAVLQAMFHDFLGAAENSALMQYVLFGDEDKFHI